MACLSQTLIFLLLKLQDSEDNAKNNKSPRSNTLTQTLDAEIVQFSKSCDFALEIRCTLWAGKMTGHHIIYIVCLGACSIVCLEQVSAKARFSYSILWLVIFVFNAILSMSVCSLQNLTDRCQEKRDANLKKCFIEWALFKLILKCLFKWISVTNIF